MVCMASCKSDMVLSCRQDDRHACLCARQALHITICSNDNLKTGASFNDAKVDTCSLNFLIACMEWLALQNHVMDVPLLTNALPTFCRGTHLLCFLNHIKFVNFPIYFVDLMEV